MSCLGLSSQGTQSWSQGGLKELIPQGLRIRTAMEPCLEEQYWDTLLTKCVPCKSLCSHQIPRTCADFCNSLSCQKEEGQYYDQLLKNCVSCSSICGRHPTQCTDFCGKFRSTENFPPEVRRQWTEEAGVRSRNLGRNQGPEHRGAETGPALPGLKLSAEDLVLVYSILGLCLGAIVCCFLLALACFLKRRRAQFTCPAQPEPCQTGTTTSNDHWLEAGSAAGPPVPVETCRFCFPERRAPTQESAGAPCTLGPERAVPGTLSSNGGLPVARAEEQDGRPA